MDMAIGLEVKVGAPVKCRALATPAKADGVP